MPSTDRISFLLFTADGADGICRSVLTLANKLADQHTVELISLYRRRKQMTYTVDPRITVTNLHDARPVGPGGKRRGGRVRIRDYPERGGHESVLDARPSQLVSAEADPHMSLLTDTLLRAKLETLEPGVLVSTRPSLHAAAVAYAPPETITVGQDHMNYVTRSSMPPMMETIMSSAPGLDCLVTLTEADRRDYEPALRGADTWIEAIPNPAPWQIGRPASLDRKVVVGAGRFVPRKGFARLIDAYELVASARPDWQLHIYGRGSEREALERQISERGLGDQVVLQGHTDAMGDVLSETAVFATGAHAEGFPMVIVEAMSQGVPVVSFDIPRGPAEIVTDGVNGRLLPDDDIDGFTDALLQLIDDRALRVRLGAAAQETAKQYEVGPIAVRWEALFSRLLERQGG